MVEILFCFLHLATRSNLVKMAGFAKAVLTRHKYNWADRKAIKITGAVSFHLKHSAGRKKPENDAKLRVRALGAYACSFSSMFAGSLTRAYYMLCWLHLSSRNPGASQTFSAPSLLLLLLLPPVRLPRPPPLPLAAPPPLPPLALLHPLDAAAAAFLSLPTSAARLLIVFISERHYWQQLDSGSAIGSSLKAMEFTCNQRCIFES